jgi:hypothetical protein
MSQSSPSLPPEFSWLRASYRPSEKEVDTYAHLIANAEGYPHPTSGSRLFDEAELQLWIWRNEMRKRANARRRSDEEPDTSSAA